MIEPSFPNDDIDKVRVKLLSSFMLFVRTFYPILMGRDFKLSSAPGREPYQITIARELRASFDGELVNEDKKPTQHLMINIPPRYGKTTMLHYFSAWCFARYPDCNFLYISYEKSMAILQTHRIREIITHPEYQKYFDVRLSESSRAKEYFETQAGGSMFAAGSGGPITGRGAGIRGCDRFGGAFIIDDIHKPIDVTSDTKREAVIDWIDNTAKSRLNEPSKTPFWVIGQTLHEADAYAVFKKDKKFKSVVIPVLDKNKNPLDPDIHTQEQLLQMQREAPYTFAAQYMQNPQPSGGGIFKPEWFMLLDLEPQIVRTFITVDTAETDKSYNDATVFSHWGLYKIRHGNVETGIWGIHWIDCREIRVEPKDLEPQFFAFYTDALRHQVKPDIAVIEKKSTGTTLISILKEMQGLRIMEMERSRSKGRAYTKIDRFLECQSYIAARRISIPRNSLHAEMCIEHCRKITANNTHMHDDIADTLQMAIQCALIEGILLPHDTQKNDEVMDKMMRNFRHIQDLRANR